MRGKSDVIDADLRVPLGALDRAVWLDRLSRKLARLPQLTQVRIARELLGRCRGLTRQVVELEREPRCSRPGRATSAKRAKITAEKMMLVRISGIPYFWRL